MNLGKVSKSVVPLILELPNEFRNKILKVALAIVQSTTKDRTSALEKICSEFELQRSQLNNILAVYIEIIKLFLNASDREFNEKLHETGFTNDFVENLPLISNRDEVVNTILNSKQKENKNLTSIKWRIDISLYSDVLASKIPKTVIIQIILKNGNKVTLELDAKTFHKLRYNVALILKEIMNSRNLFTCKK